MKHVVNGDTITITREELEKVVAACRCKAGSARTLEMQYYYAGEADAYGHQKCDGFFHCWFVD